MRFSRLGEVGQEVPVVHDGNVYRDLRPLTEDLTGPFFSYGLAEVATALEAGRLPTYVPPPNVRIGAPIPRPAAVICVGLNYAAHAAESGTEPPKHPVVFFKHPNTVVGPYDAVAIPRGSTKTDWEVELGVVIGTRASYLADPGAAGGHIAGFVAVNDLSERDFQLAVSGGQWSKGKSAAGFTPTGPWLATPDEVAHGALRMRSLVNGQVRQDASTADMIFTVEHIIYDLSQYMVLEPGDLILTGTPEGVALSGRFPYLAAGDECVVEIEGLGALRQVFERAH